MNKGIGSIWSCCSSLRFTINSNFFTGACSKYAYKAYFLPCEGTGPSETLISVLFFILSPEIIFAMFKTEQKETILLENTPGQIEMV